MRLKKSAEPARPPARPSEHNLLGVESGFRGPMGQEGLAHGFLFIAGGPERAPPDQAPRNHARNPGALQGSSCQNAFPRVNPGLRSHGPVGLPRRGYRTQPRVSTLGTPEINGSP